jgi:hypothetical protein
MRRRSGSERVWIAGTLVMCINVVPGRLLMPVAFCRHVSADTSTASALALSRLAM